MGAKPDTQMMAQEHGGVTQCPADSPAYNQVIPCQASTSDSRRHQHRDHFAGSSPRSYRRYQLHIATAHPTGEKEHEKESAGNKGSYDGTPESGPTFHCATNEEPHRESGQGEAVGNSPASGVTNGTHYSNDRRTN